MDTSPVCSKCSPLHSLLEKENQKLKEMIDKLRLWLSEFPVDWCQEQQESVAKPKDKEGENQRDKEVDGGEQLNSEGESGAKQIFADKSQPVRFPGTGSPVPVLARINRKFVCHVCHKTLKSKETLRIHLNGHTGGKPYLCPKCPRFFRVKANMREHIQLNHEPIQTFTCRPCNASFNLNRYLQEHYKSKKHQANVKLAGPLPSNDPPSVGPDLPAATDTEEAVRSLSVATDTQGDVRSLSVATDIQGDVRSLSPTINLEQENVTEQTDTIVDDHNMDTEDDANRPSAPGQPRTMENIVVHTPQLVQPPVTGHPVDSTIKKFVCPVCNKLLNSKKTLGVHIKSHYSRTQFQCPQCPQICRTKPHLQEHIKLRHEPRQLFTCLPCNATFHLNRYLYEHCKTTKHQKNVELNQSQPSNDPLFLGTEADGVTDPIQSGVMDVIKEEEVDELQEGRNDLMAQNVDFETLLKEEFEF